jgi:hypothetical protein
MENRAREIIAAVWGDDSGALFLKAVEAVDEIAGSNMERDHIHRKPITDALLQKFGLHPARE